MITLVSAVALADPPEVHPVLMFEGDAAYQPDERIAETGLSVRRFYLGFRSEVTHNVRAVAVIDLAGEHPRILDASLAWRPVDVLELTVGQAKTPMFPTARDQSIETTPLPELSTVVGALWPGRDPGVEAHLSGADLPIEGWARVGNGSGSPTGNDNPKLAGDFRLDAVFGRQRRDADRADVFGLRVGAGAHLEDAEDRGGVTGETITGFQFWRPPTISGSRTVLEGHAMIDAGPVRATVEGGTAHESRSEDTDGNPDTPRKPLPSTDARGISGEVAWMVTGQHRTPLAWPIEKDDEGPAVEVTGRVDRLWLGLGAKDVDPGGALGAELGARAWWPFGVGVGVVGQVLQFDTAPLETPDDTSALTVLARTTFRVL
ncbi:MAG: hypothetical protein ABMB14_01980 [Myxococcota bacterium]